MKGTRAEGDDELFDELELNIKTQEIPSDENAEGYTLKSKDDVIFESSDKYYPNPSLKEWKNEFTKILKELFSLNFDDQYKEKVRLNIISCLCEPKNYFAKYTGKENYKKFMIDYIDRLINEMEIFKHEYIDMINSLILFPLKLKVEYSNKQLAKLFVLLTENGIIDINNVQKLNHLSQVISLSIEFKNGETYSPINNNSFKKEFNLAKTEYNTNPKKFGDFNLTI